MSPSTLKYKNDFAVTMIIVTENSCQENAIGKSYIILILGANEWSVCLAF